MAKCEAVLRFNSNLDTLVEAIRESRSSMSQSDSTYDGPLDDSPNPSSFTLGPKDRALIEQCLQNDEGSVFEHLVYQFRLKMPRSVLQQFARHRIGVSLTVRSTRYTLKDINKDNINDLVYSCPIDTRIRDTLLDISYAIEKGHMTQDEAKVLLPEGMMTSVFVTTNARALNHMFRLRNRKKVYKPFVNLVQKIYNAIPEGHHFIFEKAMFGG